jgi:hypothetical protein
MRGIEDAYADMSEPSPTPPGPPSQPKGKNNFNYVTLYGLAGLSAYLLKHRALLAFSLLAAIQRRFATKNEKRAPLVSAVWKDAGNPSKNMRETLLAHLRRMPDLVVLHEDRHVAFRYRVEKGPAWIEIEKAGREGRALPEEEELEEECIGT